MKNAKVGDIVKFSIDETGLKLTGVIHDYQTTLNYIFYRILTNSPYYIVFDFNIVEILTDEEAMLWRLENS